MSLHGLKPYHLLEDQPGIEPRKYPALGNLLMSYIFQDGFLICIA